MQTKRKNRVPEGTRRFSKIDVTVSLNSPGTVARTARTSFNFKGDVLAVVKDEEKIGFVFVAKHILKINFLPAVFCDYTAVI